MERRWLILNCIVSLFLFLGVDKIVFGSGDADLIPPEVLKQMDPDIRAGKRPTIAKIRQGDIFGLRENPRFQEDFVTLDFKLSGLSSVQREIVEKWIRDGHNKVYLANSQVADYYPLLKPAQVATGSERVHHTSREYITCKLLRHIVNTDCKLVSYYPSDRSGSYRHICGLRNLGNDAVVIVEADEGKAVCGSFRLGEGTIYFNASANGTDSRRWALNWWHWALGLGVPGAASTDILGGGSSGLTLKEAIKYDAMILKNGDTVTGTIENEKFTLKSSYADLTFESGKIEKIVFEGAGSNVDVLRLKVGDKLSGLVQDNTIKIKLVSGTSIEVNKDKVKEIQMRKRETQEEKS